MESGEGEIIMGGSESGEQALKWTEKWEYSFKRPQAFKTTKQKKKEVWLLSIHL